VQPLPIDAHLSDCLGALDRAGSLVLIAPPGTGKSTRLPPAMVDGAAGQIYLLQPRRVAARSLAKRIAAERGWTAGREVGWRVRFEKVGGKDTRLWVMTEGTLTRQLQSDPYLDGVAAVVLDEFHERSLHTDLCLAWLAELKRTVRPDLRLVVMSATMDPAPVAAFLGGAPVMQVAAPTYPVQIRVGVGGPQRRLDDNVAAAVAEAVRDPECGDILVFLPGVGEINGALGAVRDLGLDCELIPLHGSLPPDEQDRALAPATRRKAVFATNVAETSVTIPGVRTVIDSGLARVARFNPDTGLDELKLEQISRYSATQRAGRAGRTAPGRCWRLWTALTERRMSEASDPEIARVDLAPTLNALKDWHGADPRTFPWFERPSDERLAHGEELLAMLGAAEAPFAALTALGRDLARLPVHPRLGRLLADAAKAGVPALGAALAAVVSERDIRPPRRGREPVDPAPADAIDRLHALARASETNFRWSLRDEGIDPIAAREVARVRDELARHVPRHERGGAAEAPADGATIARLLLAAYPDRVAKRSAPTSNRAMMVGGVGIEIDASCALYARTGQNRGDLLVAVQVQGLSNRGGSSTLVRQAAEIDEADIEAVFPGAIQRRALTSYDHQRGVVTQVAGWYYRDLAIRMAKGDQGDPAAVSACLAAALAPQARALFDEDETAAGWLRRCAWLRRRMPQLELPDVDDALLRDIVVELCAGCRSRAEVVAKPKLPWLQGRLSYAQSRAVDEHAPEAITVPSGSSIRLRYEDAERPPILAVRLQELFGLAQTPAIAGGAVPVLLHLLAPNYRPEQVTQDLASFWKTTYLQVRKDLRARYPKHSWPDDPLTAKAEAKGRPRQQS